VTTFLENMPRNLARRLGLTATSGGGTAARARLVRRVLVGFQVFAQPSSDTASRRTVMKTAIMPTPKPISMIWRILDTKPKRSMRSCSDISTLLGRRSTIDASARTRLLELW